VTQDDLENAARIYEEAAAELDRAAGHLRVAAEHFRNREQPRGAAHAWAARGHLLNAGSNLDEAARMQAQRSSIPDD
jgi:hypothetical protein